MPASPPSLFPDACAELDPERPALVMEGGGESLTYGELVAGSRQLARAISAHGVVAGETIAILVENRPEMLELAWAAQRSGLRYAVISTRLLPAEVAHILEDSGAAIVFTTAAFAELAAAACAGIADPPMLVGIDGERDAFSAAAAGAPPESAAEGCDLLYSSGTTGVPKGIEARLDLAPIGTPPPIVDLLTGLWGFGRDTVYLSPAPLYHAAPLRFCMTVQRLGGTVVVMEEFGAERMLAAIERFGVTHTQVVPTMMIRMLRARDQGETADLGSLRALIHAAAPCPVEIKQRMIDWLGPVVFEYYSSTENYLFTAIDSAESASHPGSVGRALLGTPHVLDEAGEEVGPGEIGQIYSEGGVEFSYRGDPDKTAASRNERGWTTVGDLGSVDADGFLYLADRRSDLIICGGVNVYPQESENALLAHPAVEDAAVIGVPSDEYGQEVKAFVVAADPGADPAALETELIEYCRGRLAAIKCPRSVALVSALPREPTGKLKKRVLREEATGT